MANFLLIKNKSKRFKRIGFLVLLIMFTAGMSAQSVITGNVSDVDGTIPGVNVVLKGTTNGTATDFDGNYSITDVPVDGVLVFSFVGYTSREVPVNGQSQINITLEVDSNTLEEVIVIGYGSMQRSNVTGSVSSISTTEIMKAPVPNVIEALRGQISGLRVQSTSGQPGSQPTFTIRGTNSLGEGPGSIGEGNQPIIVIDGVPLPGGNLSEINPADIETINVLKDAASSAIYGSSGANGVILITTKSGNSGRPAITVNASTGVVNVTQKIDFMDGDQYIKYLRDSGQGTDLAGILDPNELENYVNGVSVDWEEELLRQGTQNTVSLTFSGGTDKISYYFNGDMYDETGIVTDSDYQRYSFRFNGDYSPYDWLKVGTRVQFTKSFADQTSNVIEDFPGATEGSFAPFIPISNNTPLGDLYDEEGNYTKFVRDDRFQINPFHRYKESIVDNEITRTYINPYIEVTLTEGLTYTLNAFGEERNEFYGKFLSSDYRDGDPSEAQIRKRTSTTYLLDNIINYTKDFGMHGINATFVYGMQNNEFEELDTYGKGLPTDKLGYNAIGDVPSVDQRFNWNTDEWGKVYYVGRIGYNFDSRYVVNLTMRRDGSSKFTGKYKYGNFPSAALAWNAHNENFWGDNSVLSTLKLRLSYGELGNDRINTYRYLANSKNIQSTILVANPDDPDAEPTSVTVSGYAKDTPPNEDLRWETSKQTNIGVDFGFWNQRLSGSVDVYKTNTTDLLLSETLPVTSGYTRIISNVGETENQGVDLDLRGNIVEGERFTWEMGINWATNTNKIVRLNRANEDADGNPLDDRENGWFIGQDIREIFEYKYLGNWQLGEETEAAVYGLIPGDPKFEDINDDGAINADDRQFLGNPTPDWYGGIRNTFSYGGFQLTVLIDTEQGVTRINSNYGVYAGRDNSVAIDYWTPDNPTNAFPAVGTIWMGTDAEGNAIKTQDASFVALRNISLEYTIPQKFIERSPLKRLSIYVRGNNLKYWTDFKDSYSPESGSGGYPITKTWIFGTTISF